MCYTACYLVNSREFISFFFSIFKHTNISKFLNFGSTQPTCDPAQFPYSQEPRELPSYLGPEAEADDVDLA